MKLTHVLPQIDKVASGLTNSVPRLCLALSSAGFDLTLLTTANDRRSLPLKYRVTAFKRVSWFSRHFVSIGLLRRLYSDFRTSTVVHVHSLWSMPSLASGILAGRRAARLVCSPRGTLSTWAMSVGRTKKRIVWPVQRLLLERADVIHATSWDEYERIRELGLHAAVAVIPNGIDIPLEEDGSRINSARRRLLFLGRIHPIKALDQLLLAWKTLEDLSPEWDLIIAGPSEAGYLRHLEDLVRSLGLRRVSFPGEVSSIEKPSVYRSADLFVLPSHSENFGMVAAEALSHGVPVVASLGTPWSGLVEEGCGWWVSNDASDLASGLSSAMGQSNTQLQSMGAKGKEWMRRDFSWESVAEKMGSVYSWIAGEGPAPCCVQLE